MEEWKVQPETGPPENKSPAQTALVLLEPPEIADSPRPSEAIEAAEARHNVENDLWAIHFEKRRTSDGKGYERANPKAYQSVCVYCKVRDAWPEGKTDWTCAGTKRDMVRHLCKCAYFKNSMMKASYQRVLQQMNQEMRRASAGSPLQGIGRGRELLQKPLTSALKEQARATSEEDEYEDRMLRMMIESSIPFEWLERGSTAAWMEVARPHAPVPSRKYMETTVLDRVAKKVDEVMRKKLKTAKGVTLLIDSWTNSKGEQMLGFAVVTDDRQMYGFAVVDVTGGRENDEFLSAKLSEVVGRLEKEYEVEVRAIIADAAATCQKGRQLVVESRPDILALDCAVHQIASLTQHFFKLSSEFREVVGHATLIIAWFLGHPEAHDKLKKKTELLLGRVGALNLPSPSRWGTMADALTSLLEIGTPIHSLCVEAGTSFIDAESSANLREQAAFVVERCKDGSFWVLLEEIVRVIVPLKAAKQILDSESATLGDMLKCFGQLSQHFNGLEREETRVYMDTAIEKLWAAMDQQVFILSYVLQPENRLTYFNLNCAMCQPQVLSRFASDSFVRCSGGAATTETMKAVQNQLVDFLNREGVFAEDDGLFDGSIRYWKAWQAAAPHLSTLAIRIHGFVPRSAAGEVVWPSTQSILTKSHNRVLTDASVKMALVRADMKGKEVVGGDAKRAAAATLRPAKRLKRSPLEAGDGGEVGAAGAVGESLLQTETGNASEVVVVGESGVISEGEVEAMLEGWGWLGAQPSGEGDNTEVSTQRFWSTKKCALKDVFDSTLVPLTLFERRGDVPMVDQID